MDWDLQGPDGDPMEDFKISPAQGSASRSRQQREEEEYMQGICRGVLGGAYVEEPRRGRLDLEVEMHVAAVGTDGGRWLEPRSTSRPAFMVCKAAEAAVWQELKDIRPVAIFPSLAAMKYSSWSNSSRLHRNRLRTYFSAAAGSMSSVTVIPQKCPASPGSGRGSGVSHRTWGLKETRKCLNEQEWVDAPQVAAKRWRAIKLQHDGREIRLRDWRDFRGQYVLLRRNVEDWNEAHEQFCLLNLLPDAWVKRVTKEEAKRAKSNHTVRMMLDKDSTRGW